MALRVFAEGKDFFFGPNQAEKQWGTALCVRGPLGKSEDLAGNLRVNQKKRGNVHQKKMGTDNKIRESDRYIRNAVFSHKILCQKQHF